MLVALTGCLAEGACRHRQPVSVPGRCCLLRQDTAGTTLRLPRPCPLLLARQQARCWWALQLCCCRRSHREGRHLWPRHLLLD